MKTLGTNGLLTALCLVLAATFAADVLAEKREQTYVKENFRTVAKSSVMVGQGHELGHETTLADVKTSHPSFRVKEEWIFNHFDYADGSGMQRGTWVDMHEDGSATYGVYDGTQKTVVAADGSWEATWEGKYRYTGGTGKFKNIKGTGTYKGRASSKDAPREEGREAIEY